MADPREDLIELIADEALVDRAKLTPDATFADVGLDSVGMVSVAFAIEEKYGVEIADGALEKATNFGELLTILEEIIGQKAQA
jgi:acyl carrier protein